MDSSRHEPTAVNEATLTPGGGSLELTNPANQANLDSSRFKARPPAAAEESPVHLDFAEVAIAAGLVSRDFAAAESAAGGEAEGEALAPWQHG